MESPCPYCGAQFVILDELFQHALTEHSQTLKIQQVDFVEEGPHQWTAYYKEWRFIVRQVDGHLEVIIRANLTSDPSPEDWTRALATLNAFIKRQRIAGKGFTDPQ